jgi:hypothetical protein
MDYCTVVDAGVGCCRGSGEVARGTIHITKKKKKTLA